MAKPKNDESVGGKMKRRRKGTTGSVDTLIGANSVLEGTIHTDGNLYVEGCVRGSIEAKGEVVVGHEGKIEADIEADSVVVGGQIVGNIHARHLLEITASGRVTGDIEAIKITVREGGVVDGMFRMMEKIAGEHSGTRELLPFKSSEAT